MLNAVGREFYANANNLAILILEVALRALSYISNSATTGVWSEGRSSFRGFLSI